MKWTAKQEQAFSLKNREILVSAAAGSGKTAVMVERILNIVTGEPYVDIDKLLIVTFTKKAAESMRIKIRKELESRLKANPTDEHLQRQMLLINHAHISTIDSFCSFIVRNYFYLTDNVSSNYRIGNESEIKLLQADVLKEVLESEYKKGDDSFLSFVDYFATGKNDLPLENVILSLYKYAQSHENPTAWLNNCLEIYKEFDVNSYGLGAFIKRIIDTYIENAVKETEITLEILERPDGPYMYYDNLCDDIRILGEIKDADDLNKSIHLLENLKFSTLSRKKDAGVSDELRELCKGRRDSVKKSVSEIKDIFAYADWDSVLEDITRCKDQAAELVRVTLLFSDELLKLKKKRSIFDHGDVAHIALDILRQDESPAKKQLSELFDEIFIDEYQDSNRLQEELLYSIAKEVGDSHRVFMVGDVKQSIYSFRMACPDLFINKLRSFTESDSPFQKVFLSNNFRSRKQVVDFVNYVFENLMEKNIAGIDYDDTQKLICSSSYLPEESVDYKTELLHFEKDDEEIDSFEAEGYMIGSRIMELMNPENPLYVTERKTGIKRKLEYNDICILIRAQKDVVYPIKHVLENEFGIPVSSASVETFFESFEVGFAVNYLKILDNPYCDFPLTSVLLSPVIGVTAEDMAVIRSEDKKSSIYTLIKNAVSSDSLDVNLKNKISDFLECFNRLRISVNYQPVHKLIWQLYDLTGLEAFVSAMPSGENRLRNLKKLVNYTIDFENTDYHSLFDFLRYIEKIIEYDIQTGGQESPVSSDNSVKIMTMHKSKGLEFPVVFLAGLNKGFNFSDERAGVLLHPELGIGFDSIDTAKRTRRKSIMKRLIHKQMHIDKYGEEIRILYVAMTRAEEKLILTCCHDKKNPIEQDSMLSYFDILKAKRYWDWLKKTLGDVNPLCDIKTFMYDDFIRIHEENKLRRQVEIDSSEKIIDDVVDYEWINNLDHVYESKLDDSFKKISVTYLKEQYNLKDEEGELQISESLIEKEVEFPIIPEFLKETEGLSGAQRGLIYHSVLEHWDYDLSDSKEEILCFCHKLFEKGIFTDEEISVINPIKISRFLNNRIGKRMKKAYLDNKLKREASFSVILNHKDQGFDFIDQDVLLQGIIDAYFEEDDQLVIVDYKTDYLPDGDINYLVEKYSMQLKCYAYALEKITGKKVKETWIYSLYCDDSIKIDS